MYTLCLPSVQVGLIKWTLLILRFGRERISNVLVDASPPT
jgi:hypothetical protein